jgi:hypothetical protein
MAASTPFIAYGLFDLYPTDGNSDLASNLIVLDLAHHRRYIASLSAAGVTQAVLRPTGSVAFLRQEEAGFVVPTDVVACPMPSCYDRHHEARNDTILDAGAIDSGSLALHGTSLTWTNAGVAKSATLE